MKSIFARYGIPKTIVSDNGPQFSSFHFREFCTFYDIQYTASSPEHPKSNGLAENSVKAVKRLLKKASRAKEDPYLALLAYRSTPTADGLPSPAERLFGRKIRSRLPSFIPLNRDKDVLSKLKDNKVRQKYYYDKTAKNLSILTPGATVRVRQGSQKEWSSQCKVLSKTEFPRSYVIRTPQGTHLRRNRKDLLETPEEFEVESNSDCDSPVNVPVKEEVNLSVTPRGQTNEGHYVTRSGCISKPPQRYS